MRESNAYKAMAELARAGEDGLSTRAVAASLFPSQPAQRGQSWVGNNFRVHEGAGLIERVGHEMGSYHNIPSIRWRVTDKGRVWLEERKDGIEEAQKRHAVIAAGAEQRRAERQRRQRLAEGAAADYADLRGSHGSDRELVARRREVVARLRGEGLSLAQIAYVFGVSREMVRLDLRALGIPGERARTQPQPPCVT